MPTKTQAIKSFLANKTHSDLASFYNHNMECQVLVAQDHGERIEGDFKGTRWHGYSDGSSTWKSFRIPYHAATDPEFIDKEITFDLGKHCEAVGLTGWDWFNRVSKWVAYDFDAIVGHSDKHANKLSVDSLEDIRNKASELDWVTVRLSTSGKGLHLYVFVDDVPTSNHTEHAALARSILNKMSALTGFDFKSKVDICGGNMWFYHRKMIGTDGLSLIKQGGVLTSIPADWRDHVSVTTGKSKRTSIGPDYEELSSQRSQIKLDKDHIRLIKYLDDNELYHIWSMDHHMLVTHTSHLKSAHVDLSLKGVFETTTKGTTTHNCFLYPLHNGAWSVRRYGRGVQEHPTWEQDGKNWTRCYFNLTPTLKTVSISVGGLEDTNGSFVFNESNQAFIVAKQLGTNVELPPKYQHRPSSVKTHKDGRLIVSIDYQQGDNGVDLPGWLHKGSNWVKIFEVMKPESDMDIDSFDDRCRHMISESQQDAGWVINSNNSWIDEPLVHIKPMLSSLGLKGVEVTSVIGSNVLKPWTIVNRPFQPEYPGDRLWNRRAAQLNYSVSLGDVFKCQTWDILFSHIGKYLDDAVKSHTWCQDVGITSGADYLRLWVSSMIQYPTEPLPYLFIYSDKQETGKTTFHEALELLFSPGYMKVDKAMEAKGDFNAELLQSILCVIEEIDLSSQKAATYNRIKECVTAKRLLIHPKYCTPYLVSNTCHFIQCSNNRMACPIFPGDTRIMMIHVADRPEKEIPRRDLTVLLEKEASDFLGKIMSMEIPEYSGRLRLPVIETADKIQSVADHENALQRFIREQTYYVPGGLITCADFYERFIAYLDPMERINWPSKQSVSSKMPDIYVKGRPNHGTWYWGNISFTKGTETEMTSQPFIVVAPDRLVRKPL